jgi:hypothetical protein
MIIFVAKLPDDIKTGMPVDGKRGKPADRQAKKRE